MKHTLEDAILICRYLDTQSRAEKKNFHFALGGSCLMKGSSDKDIDIFIYPRSDENLNHEEVKDFFLKLHFSIDSDCSFLGSEDNEEYPTDKPMMILSFEKYRVDLFFCSFVMPKAQHSYGPAEC